MVLILSFKASFKPAVNFQTTWKIVKTAELQPHNNNLNTNRSFCCLFVFWLAVNSFDGKAKTFHAEINSFINEFLLGKCTHVCYFSFADCWLPTHPRGTHAFAKHRVTIQKLILMENHSLLKAVVSVEKAFKALAVETVDGLQLVSNFWWIVHTITNLVT